MGAREACRSHGERAGGRRGGVGRLQHALMRQVLRTELIRVKALIATAVVLASWCLASICSTPTGSSISGGAAYAGLSLRGPGSLHPVRVVGASQHQPALRLDRDLPVFRRYLGALIETSMPTVVLALHIESMGRVEALGFVVPFTYFIFIILSTLRLDFWLSTFTGFVAAAELFCMAMFYHPAGAPIRRPISIITRCAA